MCPLKKGRNIDLHCIFVSSQVFSFLKPGLVWEALKFIAALAPFLERQCLLYNMPAQELFAGLLPGRHNPLARKI